MESFYAKSEWNFRRRGDLNLEITSNYASHKGTEITVTLSATEINGECKFIVTTEIKNVEKSSISNTKTFDTFESAVLEFYYSCYQSRNTIELEDNCYTEKRTSLKPRTLQEIADFFGCYVAKDANGRAFAYETMPIRLSNDFGWTIDTNNKDYVGGLFSIADAFIKKDNIDWRVLYKGN